MKRELIAQLHASFEKLVRVEEQTKVEFWLARDLQKVLGYERWENFEKVVHKAISACEVSGYAVTDDFLRNHENDPSWEGCGTAAFLTICSPWPRLLP